MSRDDAVTSGLIEEKKLSNRVCLRLYDHSRRLAADRWLIRLHGEARIAPDPELYAGIGEEDPELVEAIRERLGEELVFTLDKERNFVAEKEKKKVFAELLAQVNAHLLAYLASPTFPEKLFRRRWEDLKAGILLEQEQERKYAELDENDGPADFSFLFRDSRPGEGA